MSTKECCAKFKEELKRCNIYHKVQYGTDGTKYDSGFYYDTGEKIWSCPFCNEEKP